MARAHAVGDIHGHPEILVRLLRESCLVDERLRWNSMEPLWLVGDYVDHGPAGIEAVDLVMRLQREAAALGVRVAPLLGNHDLLLLAAHRFGAQPMAGDSTFLAHWRENGGSEADLRALTDRHIEWLSGLPLLARHNRRLFAHADSPFYGEYGASVPAVNLGIARILAGDDTGAWSTLIARFGRHGRFAGLDGPARAARFLATFGGDVLIHGHTPIHKHPASTRQDGTSPAPDSVTGPLHYADGVCIDIDGGIYLGGPGFIYRSADLPPA